MWAREGLTFFLLESAFDTGSNGRAVDEEGFELVAHAAIIDLRFVEHVLYAKVKRQTWANRVANVGVNKLAGLEVLIA